MNHCIEQWEFAACLCTAGGIYVVCSMCSLGKGLGVILVCLRRLYKGG